MATAIHSCHKLTVTRPHHTTAIRAIAHSHSCNAPQPPRLAWNVLTAKLHAAWALGMHIVHAHADKTPANKATPRVPAHAHMLRAFASARLRELGTPRQGWITRDVHRFGTRAGRAPVWYESLSAQRVMSSGTGGRRAPRSGTFHAPPSDNFLHACRGHEKRRESELIEGWVKAAHESHPRNYGACADMPWNGSAVSLERTLQSNMMQSILP